MTDSNRNGDNPYKYEAMSNKVIQSERKPRNNNDSVNYNPTSLAGQISVKDMGSGVPKSQNSTLSTITKVRSNSTTPNFALDSNKLKNKTSAYNNYSGSFEELSYHPTNPENAHVLELIMSEIHSFLPDVSHHTILSAADVFLEILKSREASITEQRNQLNDLLQVKLDDVRLNELVNLSKRITDYDIKEFVEGDDEQTVEDGVAVVFDNSDEENDLEQEVSENEETADSLGINEIDEEAQVDALETNNETIISSRSKSEPYSIVVPVEDIDAFYLQRKLSSLYSDRDSPSINEMANSLMSSLQNLELDERDLENELMEILEYENFDFVKLCIKNRWRIVFKIKFLETETEEEKETLFSHMYSINLDDIVAELETSTKYVDKSLKEQYSETDSDEAPRKRQKVEPKRVPKIVDLDGFTFDQGPHLMSNNKVKLPQGSYQQNKKLYDVISIPPPAPPPTLDEANEKLVSISEIPEWARVTFPAAETSSLNRIQSKIYPKAFGTDENILLCAPTGAGKTNVAMLTFLRTINNHRNSETGHIDLGKFKMVYVAPLKALVQEQMREFQRRLTANFGIIVNELTGDSTLSKSEISETQLLITTPEKWDVITRKTDEGSYTNLVRLIIIDEIHLLHDDRGPVLESIISRSIRHSESTGQPIRLVGLSATLPNYEDVASFLRVNFNQGLFYFDSSYRPCPLEQQFIGIKEKKAIKKINAMNEACYDKLIECAQNKHQVIIFVHSRKDTFKTAKWLRDKLAEEDKLDLIYKSDAGSSEILRQEAEDMDNKSLKEIVPSGFGIHHAGLNKSERSVVEDLFAQGHLQILISTATLAWGVNLPAHTVIIKGTETYSPEKGAWVQLSPQDILQMLGRAGRPRYDKSGEGVIITSQDEIQYYLAILNQQLPIESQLMSRLVDNLNAEIVLGSVKSREEAVTWLGYTYLYIRMLKSPALYHVGAEYSNDDSLFWKRMDLIHSALTILDKNKLVVYNAEDGDIKSTELGKIASHYYINYPTINMYNSQLKSWMSEIDILRVFSSSGEFKFIPVRQEERLEISKLLEKCPFPVKENAAEPVAKVNLLLQAYISKLSLDGFALMADMIYITQSAGRLLRAIHEIVLRKNWSSLARTTLSLCKMVERRIWLTNSPFRQFGADAPKDIIRATESSHLPWVSYFNLNAAELAEAINFKGHSQKAYDLLQQFPTVSMSYYAQPITPSLVRVQLAVMPEWTWNIKYHGGVEPFVLLVEDCDGDKILHTDRVVISRAHSSREHLIEFTVPIAEPVQPNYYINLISERWLHSETRIPLILYDIKLPKKFPPFTELLDLHRMPVADLKNSEFHGRFDFMYFNKAQTQVFQALYQTNENLFVGLSKGSGKTVCAELAILNHWKQNKGRIVYIQPNQRVIDRLLKGWKRKFTGISSPDKMINKLTGDRTQDVALLSSSHLTLATPEQFDVLSRRWRQRKAVRSIELIIADDAHMVGNEIQGVAYETILARLRFVSSQLQNEFRIIALSNPLANARDFGEWIGCSKQNIFNFSPSYRAHPIQEIRLQSTGGGNSTSASSQSLTTSYEFIMKNKGNGRSTVFVPSRKECVEVASNILLKATSDKWSLLGVDIGTIEPYLQKISDIAARELVSNGIGVFYDGMSELDKLIVEKLFTNDILPVLVASRDTASYIPSCTNVAVLGTQEYDGKEYRYIDYSINSLLEMVGTSQNDDNSGKVLIITNSSKLSYYNKFLHDALPVESVLNISVHDSFINEIASGTFKSRQDCVDWITFTYFYRRLQFNPSFYDVKDTGHLGISEHLSDLVEDTLNEMVETKLIELKDDDDEDVEEEEEEEEITPLNSCMIASYYNISFATMKQFTKLNNKTKLKGILEVLASASEFGNLPIRLNEESLLRKLYNRVPVKATDVDYESPYFKAFVLLQAHFSRIPLAADLANDQKVVLEKSLNILGACIDTLSSEGYLNAINAMDLSQMIVQAVWNRDSPLRQIPFVNDGILSRAKKYNVENIYDIMSLEDDERDDVLQLTGAKLDKVAEFVNKYPNVDMSYELDLSEPIKSNAPKEIMINLERDEEMDDVDVVSTHYPLKKSEGWWVFIGDSASKQLYAIKKTQIIKESQQVKLEFTIPNVGHHKLSIWCMCDSYMDADKEVEFEIEVVQGEEEEEA